MSQSQVQIASSGIARIAQTWPLASFFTLAYFWTWITWLVVPPLVRQHQLGWKFDTFDITLIVVGAFGPTVAAFVTQWLAYRNLKICSVWTGWRTMALGLGCGLIVFFIATVAMPAIALAKAPIYSLHWSALAHWSLYNINYSSFLGGPINEEPGWRGFALPRLQARFGPFFASAILAPLWAIWHLPMFLIPGWNTGSVWEYVLLLFGVSLLLTVAANLACFGILVPVMLHLFFNFSTRVMNGVIANVPTRAHDVLIYTLTVCGTAIGMSLMAFQRYRASTDAFRAYPVPRS